MKSDNEVFDQIELLDHYRQKAKEDMAKAAPGSGEYEQLSRLYLNYNGAIDALNWVVGNPSNQPQLSKG
jgi:hypothetical protein